MLVLCDEAPTRKSVCPEGILNIEQGILNNEVDVPEGLLVSPPSSPANTNKGVECVPGGLVGVSALVLREHQQGRRLMVK